MGNTFSIVKIRKYWEFILIINSTLNIILVNYVKKVSQKLHALAKVSAFMSCRQKKIIMNAFITSQFGHCHNINIHRQIDRIHERALRIVYMDNNSSFEGLLKKSGSVIYKHMYINEN